jgi:hypothetical protein
MPVSSPARQRLGRTLSDARSRRHQRLDRDRLYAGLASYRTTAEISELSAIAARNDHTDTGELRTIIARQLSQ